MASHKVRVAMLNAEDPVPLVLSTRGSFGTIFHNLLCAAASRLSSNIEIASTEYDVRKFEYPPDLSLVDAVLITGSASSAYNDFEWIHRLDEYILDLYINHPRIKIFGSCFGHQIICQSLLKTYGVRVEKDPKGYENGVHEITLTQEFREALRASSESSPVPSNDGPSRRAPEKMRLQFVHDDHVRLPSPDALPKTWVNFGSTASCSTQGVYEPGRVFTLQGHFEFDRFVNAETLKFFGKILPWTQKQLQGYLDLVDADDDSEVAAEMVVRFFLEDSGDRSSRGSEVVSGLLTPPLGA